MKQVNAIFSAIAATCSIVAHGHGLLAKPRSKNVGNLSTSSTTTAGTHFTIASFGIVDKAFFDGDHGITPWTRPGEFDYEMAHNLIAEHPQTLHPCGCNAGGPAYCAGVEQATGFGETMPMSGLGTTPMVTPPDWTRGSNQETGWNAYANHSGGYIYMLCKKTEYDTCRDTHFPNGPRGADWTQEDAYLKCVWDCFESTTLEWVPGSQKLQFQDDACTYASTEALTKVGKADRVWRYTPIPDSLQVTNGGEGNCTWDSVTSFSNSAARAKFTESFGPSTVCDNGRDAHNPKDWNVMDQVKIPENIPEGEYLLSWRWDVYMADQMWTNCADVQIVSSSSTTTTSGNGPSLRGSASSDPECPTTPTPQPAAPSPTITKAPSPTSTKAPSPAPECTDFELPGNWGANGIYTCDYYNGHGGVAYCTHTVINEACCFCGGGDVTEQISPAPSAQTSLAPSAQSVTLTGTISFKLSKMSSNLFQGEAIEVVDAIQGELATLLKSNKFKDKTKAEFVNISLSWENTTFRKNKNFIKLKCIVQLDYATHPKTTPLKKAMVRAMKRKNVSAIKKINNTKFEELKRILSHLKVA